jgi:hypothetical protein
MAGDHVGIDESDMGFPEKIFEKRIFRGGIILYILIKER